MRLQPALFKMIRLHFLAPELTAQNSLFLLFILALSDEVFGTEIHG